MLQDPQDWSVAFHRRQLLSSNNAAKKTHHRTPVHLESVPSIAAAEIRVEDHLLVSEVSVEVARAVEVGNRCTKFCQKRCCGSVVDRWRNGTPFEGPHLHALRCPEHDKDAAPSGVERGAGELAG